MKLHWISPEASSVKSWITTTIQITSNPMVFITCGLKIWSHFYDDLQPTHGAFIIRQQYHTGSKSTSDHQSVIDIFHVTHMHIIRHTLNNHVFTVQDSAVNIFPDGWLNINTKCIYSNSQSELKFRGTFTSEWLCNKFYKAVLVWQMILYVY